MAAGPPRPAAPAPLRLLGAKAVCGGTFRPPRPGFRPGARLRRCPRPAVARGSAGRSPGRSPPGSLAPPVGAGRRPGLRRRPWPPAASLRAPLRLRPARSRGPRPGRSGRPGLAPCVPGGPPCAGCGLPVFPWAVPRCGSPRGCRARPLPSVVPPSVGGLGPLRAPALPPGAYGGAPPRFSGPPAPGVGVGVFRRCGGGHGDHKAVAKVIKSSYDISDSDSQHPVRSLSCGLQRSDSNGPYL